MRKRFIKTYIITLVVVFVVVVINITGGHFIEGVLYRVGSIPHNIAQRDLPWVSSYVRSLLDVADTVQENHKLKQRDKELTAQLARFEQLERENERLRKQLDINVPSSVELLPVSIIDIQRTTLSAVIVIDKGTSSGISKGMPVIAHGNVLAGVVEETFKNYSRVTLVDDPRTVLSVRIANTDILSKSTGKLDRRINLDLIGADDALTEGQLVVTSGLDDMPASLLVGRIIEAASQEGALFQNVVGEMIFEITLGPELFILK